MTDNYPYVTCKKDNSQRRLACTFCTCGNITPETLRMRNELHARHITNQLATENLEIDEFGYVI